MLGQAFAHCPIFPTAASRRSLDRVSVPVWPFSLSARLPIVDLVGRCPANYLMGREPLLQRISPLTPPRCRAVVSCGISDRFRSLSPSKGQVAHALLTRSPLSKGPKPLAPFDLHVLGTPPAFVLSQDQTLEFNLQQILSDLPLTSLLRLRCLLSFNRFSSVRYIVLKVRPAAPRQPLYTTRPGPLNQDADLLIFPVVHIRRLLSAGI